MIGLELDRWNPHSSDGTIRDKRVFEASRGCAYFVHCNSYINIVRSDLRKGFCARLQGFEKETQFNGKTAKIVCWVSEKKRWKVRLLENDTERRYLGVRSQNLVPILDWHDDTNVYAESLELMPNVGDRVKIRDNRWGIVEYIGAAPFVKDDEVIGLELDTWTPNANDGSNNGVRYLTTTDGRGYFARCKHLIDNVGTIDWPTGLYKACHEDKKYVYFQLLCAKMNRYIDCMYDFNLMLTGFGALK